MPGRDGWELLLELKRDRGTREIPVVLCSVLDEPRLALSLGAAGYLHKPIDQGQLVGALSRFR
jgi:CheY-like chemotaxis protein